MEDTHNKELETLARELCNLLSEHKAEAACVLDLRSFSIWTDFFVVATAQSTAHLDGLKRHVDEWLKAHPLERPPHRGKNRTASGAGNNALWEVIDLGGIVLHLMSKEAREFYELEKLWGTLPS